MLPPLWLLEPTAARLSRRDEEEGGGGTLPCSIVAVRVTVDDFGFLLLLLLL